MKNLKNNKGLRVALVVPHIFMFDKLLKEVIFSPGTLAIQLADGLVEIGCDVTLFSPGAVTTKARNINSDLTHFEAELKLRGDDYLDLLKKHPLTFITLARQAQSQLIANAYDLANKREFDIVHIYTNEEEMGMVFAKLCKVPVVFTHHEPFNFLAKYRSIMKQYMDLNWIAISDSQKASMPKDTNFISTIHHGIPINQFEPNYNPKGDYLAYFGRIIEPKGVHLAIKAAKKAGIKLKIAGKHYEGVSKDKYWSTVIEPQIDKKNIEYVGFLNKESDKEEFLGNAKALIVPSIWEEPFGLVTIEALACGTPVIGSNNGATKEIIDDGRSGYIVDFNKGDKVTELVKAIKRINKIDRRECRREFEKRFTSERMVKNYYRTYLGLKK